MFSSNTPLVDGYVIMMAARCSLCLSTCGVEKGTRTPRRRLFFLGQTLAFYFKGLRKMKSWSFHFWNYLKVSQSIVLTTIKDPQPLLPSLVIPRKQQDPSRPDLHGQNQNDCSGVLDILGSTLQSSFPFSQVISVIISDLFDSRHVYSHS